MIITRQPMKIIKWLFLNYFLVEKCTVKESGGVSNENNDEWQKIMHGPPVVEEPRITIDALCVQMHKLAYFLFDFLRL